MTPEERALLNRIAQQVDENNDILHGIRSSMRWSKIWSAVYWTLIIGASLGAYWFIQPYINQLLDVYSGAQSNIDSVKGMIGNYTQQ